MVTLTTVEGDCGERFVSLFTIIARAGSRVREGVYLLAIRYRAV